MTIDPLKQQLTVDHIARRMTIQTVCAYPALVAEFRNDADCTPVAQVEVVVWLSLVIRVPDNVRAQRRLVLQQFRDFTQDRLRSGLDRIPVCIEVQPVDRYAP
jgi:hypothetical protein